jgi:hypothetical protein
VNAEKKEIQENVNVQNIYILIVKIFIKILYIVLTANVPFLNSLTVFYHLLFQQH